MPQYTHTTQVPMTVISSSVINSMGAAVERLERDQVRLTSISGFVVGAADNTTAFSNALDEMNSTGGTLYIEPGLGAINIGQIRKTYAPRIVCGKGSWLQNLNNSATPSHWLSFEGSISTTGILLAANTAQNGRDFTLTAGGVASLGIQVGDIISVGKAVPWSTDVTTGRDREYIGQSFEVRAIAGEVVSTQEPALTTFNTAETSYVWKWTPIENVYIDGLEMRGIYDAATRGLDIEGARNVYIKDFTIRDHGSMGLRLLRCFNYYAEVNAINLKDNASPNYNYGYGVCTEGSCTHGEVHVRGIRCRHAFTTNGEQKPTSGTGSAASHPLGYGGVMNLIVRGFGTQCTAEAFDTHASGANINFVGVVAVGNSGGGMQLRSPLSTAVGCHFQNNKHHLKLGWCATDAQIFSCYFGRTNLFGDGDTTSAAAIRIENEANNQFRFQRAIKGCIFEDIWCSVVRYGSGFAHTCELSWEENTITNYGIGNIGGQQSVFQAYSTTNKVSNIKVRRGSIRSNSTAPHLFYATSTTEFDTGGHEVVGCDIGTNITDLKSGFDRSFWSFWDNLKNGVPTDDERTVTGAASMTLDVSRCNTIRTTMSGNITTLTITNPKKGQRWTWIVTTNGASQTIAWPATVKPASASNGTMPALPATSGVSRLFTFYWDGTTHWCESV
jgi:hypothetical protein